MEEFHKRSSKRKRNQKKLQHLFGRHTLEEQRQIKEKSKARRGDWTRTRKRQRDRDEEDDDGAGFEKIQTGRDRVLGRDAGPNRRASGVTIAVGADAQAVGVPALVVAVHKTGVIVRLADRREVLARVPRALRLVVGDEVRVGGFELDLPHVTALTPRRSELGRPDPGNANERLLLAANVDLAVLVLSVVTPPLRPRLADRFLVALAESEVEPLLCVNKLDLFERQEQRVDLERELRPYRELGLSVFPTSAATGEGIERLRERIAGKTCVFVGHSGTGKSSLLNRLDPSGEREVGGVRASDGKGRHTTTSSELVELEGGTRLIDTPGVRTFGLWKLSAAELRAALPELAAFAPRCRFADCSHVHEPGCAVLAALERGELSSARYDAYRRLLESLDT